MGTPRFRALREAGECCVMMCGFFCLFHIYFLSADDVEPGGKLFEGFGFGDTAFDEYALEVVDFHMRVVGVGGDGCDGTKVEVVGFNGDE